MKIDYLAAIIWLIIAVAVFKNAKARNLKAATSWGIITFLFGPFGLIGYYFMIMKPNKKDI